MAGSGRLHAMDNLRALAMFAGVLFHAGLAYSALAHDFVPTADRAQSVALDAGLWFVHLFRMPLFFLVAGYFAARLVAMRGVGGMLRNRVRRVGLPFLLFLPPTYLALKHATLQAAITVQHPSPLLAMIRPYALMPDLPAQPPGTAHLWFLYYLMLFCVLVWSARTLGMGAIAARLRRLRPGWQLGLLPLLLVPSLAAVTAPHPAPESLLPQFWAIGYFGPCFAFGYLLHGHEAAIARLRPVAPWLVAASVLLYLVFWLGVTRQAAGAAHSWFPWALAVLEAYIGAWMTLACLILGWHLLDRRHAVLRYLADASYWTYLLHLPILFALQYRLMDLDWPWPAKFAVAVATTLALCMGSYQLLVRGTRFGAFIGVENARRPPPLTTAAASP